MHRSVKAEFLQRLVKRVAAMRIGDPIDPATQVGALISEQHMQKVLGYIDAGARKARASWSAASVRTQGALAKGSFVAPTVFDGCHDAMGIVREEIFGPVMSVLEFDDEAGGHRARQCHRIRACRRRLHQ